MKLLALFAVAIWIVVTVFAFLRYQHDLDERQRLDDLIRPARYREEFRRADETLPKRAALRRMLAEAKRLEAAQITSGDVERPHLIVRHR